MNPTALERLEHNLAHAGDAGTIWQEQNELSAINQYNIERILEACNYQPSDDSSIEEDIERILAWINDRKGA